MGNWVNFAEVRATVPIEAVLLEMYGLTNLKKEGDKLIGPCPVHNGDGPRAFHADLTKNVWHCFSRCQKGGNQIDLVSEKEGISTRDAALKLQSFFSGRPPEVGPRAGPGAATAKSPQAAPPFEAKNPVLAIELRVRHDHPHLLQGRKLKESTASTFGVGYCSQGTLKGTIAIPIHDEDGHLVAYAGRRLKPDDIRNFGKYKFPKGFKKELVVYNLHRAAQTGKERGLVIVEGFFAVLGLHQAGIENVVALMGCELGEHQLALLAAFPETVLLFDGDEAGRTGSTSAREKLAGKTLVRTIHLPTGMKPDELGPRALKWLVNGIQLLDLEEIDYRPRRQST